MTHKTFPAFIAAILLAVLVYQSSPIVQGARGDAVLSSNAGAWIHIGDCAVDRYDLPQSGSAGYCYTLPASVPVQAHGHKSMAVSYALSVIVQDVPEVVPVLPACVSDNPFHPCP